MADLGIVGYGLQHGNQLQRGELTYETSTDDMAFIVQAKPVADLLIYPVMRHPMHPMHVCRDMICAHVNKLLD